MRENHLTSTLIRAKLDIHTVPFICATRIEKINEANMEVRSVIHPAWPATLACVSAFTISMLYYLSRRIPFRPLRFLAYCGTGYMAIDELKSYYHLMQYKLDTNIAQSLGLSKHLPYYSSPSTYTISTNASYPNRNYAIAYGNPLPTCISSTILTPHNPQSWISVTDFNRKNAEQAVAKLPETRKRTLYIKITSQQSCSIVVPLYHTSQGSAAINTWDIFRLIPFSETSWRNCKDPYAHFDLQGTIQARYHLNQDYIMPNDHETIGWFSITENFIAHNTAATPLVVSISADYLNSNHLLKIT